MNAVGIDVSKGKSMVAIMRPFPIVWSPPKLLPLYLCLCKFAIFYQIVFLIFIVRE